MRGTYLIGSFVEAKQMARADGTLVAGFFGVVVDVGQGSQPFRRDATYFAASNETGEETDAHRSAAKFLATKPKPGAPVAVQVRARASKPDRWGRMYVNYELVSIVAFDAAPIPAAA